MPQQTAQVVVGTPGTVLDWLQRRCFDPKKLRVFCLDEADVMIATQGHQEQSYRIKRFCIYLSLFLISPLVYSYTTVLCIF